MGDTALRSAAPVSEFAQELRSRVKAHFQAEATRRGIPVLDATKATPRRWAEMAVFAALFVATLPSFFRGEWWTLVGTPLMYWFWGVNCFHDASHFAVSRNWITNMAGTYIGFWFSSPFEWYHQHVIGHHAYPNIPRKDPDLYHNGTFERHTKSLRHKPLHNHQHLTFLPIWFIGVSALNYLKPIQLVLSGYYNRAVKMVEYPTWRVYVHVLGRLAVLLATKAWPFFVFESTAKAWAFSIVPEGMVSIFFMISSQVDHLTDKNVDVVSTDYYAHQVLTGHSFMADGLAGLLNFYFTGGLNLQIEHHLFPCVNHCHLPAIRPIVKAVCKKHGVFYHESSGLSEALGKYYEHMKTLGVHGAIEASLEELHEHEH